MGGEPGADKTGGAFALYLLANPAMSGAAAARLRLGDLEVQPEPLLTAADVQSYDWASHTLELTERGAAKIPATPNVATHGLPFVVFAQGRRAFLGAFWTSLSSQSFPHPVIMVDPPTTRRIYVIERAYPTAAAAAAGADPRQDESVKQALSRAGKLTTRE